MKRGFFGGSFDPIHFGHIRLVVELMEMGGLDEVVFCPTSCSPFKVATPPVASGEHRLKMLKLSLEGVPGCKVSSVEVDRGGVSYTIDTLRELGGQWRLLLTDEVAGGLSRWKESSELLRIAPPLMGQRKDAISSTEIRKRLAQKRYCGHLVPPKALDYLLEHRLYSV